MTVSIHPSAFVGEGVTLGERVTIGPNVVILGPSEIGNDVWVGPGTVIGAPPEMSDHRQNEAWNGDLTHQGVRIGDGTVIRELSTIHQGSQRPTTVGQGCWILNRSYVAHDVLIGDEVTLSAGVSIGGHCLIANHVNIGMNAAVHQRRVISAGAMIGMNTPVSKDVPPYAKVFGSPPRLGSVNRIGMSRLGIDHATIEALAATYASGDYRLADPDPFLSIRAEVEWWQTHQGADTMLRPRDC